MHDTNLLLLSTVDAWNRFKCHTIYIEDDAVKQRLDTLITSIPDAHTAFGLEIRMCLQQKYHTTSLTFF